MAGQGCATGTSLVCSHSEDVQIQAQDVSVRRWQHVWPLTPAFHVTNYIVFMISLVLMISIQTLRGQLNVAIMCSLSRCLAWYSNCWIYFSIWSAHALCLHPVDMHKYIVDKNNGIQQRQTKSLQQSMSNRVFMTSRSLFIYLFVYLFVYLFIYFYVSSAVSCAFHVFMD